MNPMLQYSTFIVPVWRANAQHRARGDMRSWPPHYASLALRWADGWIRDSKRHHKNRVGETSVSHIVCLMHEKNESLEYSIQKCVFHVTENA